MTAGAAALASYAEAEAGVTRFIVADGDIRSDTLSSSQLASWVDGDDPLTGERRGRDISSPDADLVLDGTINAPKTYSLAALLNPELGEAYEQLMDRLRDRVISTWQRELNARRGAGGMIREGIHRLEVVELRHRRSRALDPHIHRHLWLNVRVQGEDGRWSNVDSRVAMRLHTVINAEGELAARTDPQWISALAAKGYTVGPDGEIVELRSAVRPLSRRSNQIEANRAMKLAEWSTQHPDQEPSRDILQQIDRWAWAQGRPNKPGQVDESSWEQMVRDEIAEVDPRLLQSRGPVHVSTPSVADLDRDLLSSAAVVEADKRAASTGGRFSRFDLRACAMRAIAATGVVADRELLVEVIEDVASRGLDQTIDMLDRGSASDAPAHIKAFVSTSTAMLKLDLAARFDELNQLGVRVPDQAVTELAGSILEEGRGLDDGQTAAAGAIAGTDRLVTVTGPAGTGKTTMLKVARAALERQGRRLVVVAPTKKAALVAGREVGAEASSLHALLLDHGFRWETDTSGAEVWAQRQLGEADPRTGAVFEGPRRFALRPGDRIVVDEAGMVDLKAAHALATLAEQTGAGIAMVGDHLQAMPVGHSGAMATMARRSGAVVELSAVHRFVDPAYGALSLRLRDPGSMEAAAEVANLLRSGGHVAAVSSAAEARDLMVETYFRYSASRRRVALVTATNAEAQEVNHAIQQRRVQLGELSLTRIAVGRDQQRILVGDVVQTRRNDRDTGVENRANWVIRRIHSDGSVTLGSLTDSTDIRRLSAQYLAQDVHLAYASTVHGIQGETVDVSVVGPDVDASGLYVGMTRGRQHNLAVVVAQTGQEEVRQLASTMFRGSIEVTLDDSRAAAARELARAAVSPVRVSQPPASWNDRQRRPLGSVINLATHRERTLEKITALRAELVDGTIERVAQYEQSLRELDAQIAAAAASNHAVAAAGGQPGNEDELWHERGRVVSELDAARARQAELAPEYRRARRTLEAVDTEAATRANMDTQNLAREDRARTEHVRERQRSSAAPDVGADGPGLN